MDTESHAPVVTDRRAYLGTHRALAACTRELSRLTDALCRGANALVAAGASEKLEIRLTPDRAVLQLGPVALTVAWLRGTLGTVEGGELLVIVWRGVVARRGAYRGTTPGVAASERTATMVWEETFTVTAADEATWLWRTATQQVGGDSSTALAERCVDRLRTAYGEERARARQPLSA
jgi:hypothetical protein